MNGTSIQDLQKQGQIKQNNNEIDVDIEDLARDINDNIPDDSFSTATEHNDVVASKFGLLNYLPEMFRRPFIVFTVFLILSQPVVRNTFARYIGQLNPNETGEVPFSGIVIYGLIFAILYAVFERLFVE